MSRRHLVTSGLSVLAAGVLAGCPAQNVQQVGEQPRAAITYAARAHYPGNAQMSDRIKAVAVTEPEGKMLTVYNYGADTIPSTALWANGAFVKEIAPIPPRGNVRAKYSELLEAGPGVRTFSEVSSRLERVELQTPDGLYTVQGPVNR